MSAWELVERHFRRQTLCGQVGALAVQGLVTAVSAYVMYFKTSRMDYNNKEWLAKGYAVVPNVLPMGLVQHLCDEFGAMPLDQVKDIGVSDALVRFHTVNEVTEKWLPVGYTQYQFVLINKLWPELADVFGLGKSADCKLSKLENKPGVDLNREWTLKAEHFVYHTDYTIEYIRTIRQGHPKNKSKPLLFVLPIQSEVHLDVAGRIEPTGCTASNWIHKLYKIKAHEAVECISALPGDMLLINYDCVHRTSVQQPSHFEDGRHIVQPNPRLHIMLGTTGVEFGENTLCELSPGQAGRAPLAFDEDGSA